MESRDRSAQASTPIRRERSPYWETEEPTEVRCGYVILRHYEHAGKLQVVGTVKGDDGKERFAKVVTIDVPTLRGCPEAVAIIARAANVDAPF